MSRFLVILVVTVTTLATQNAICKDLLYKPEKPNFSNTEDTRILRGNIWNGIKASAQNVWKMIETLAENTKDKINSWINDVKCSADKIKEDVESNLKDLKNESEIILEEIVGATQVVKKCIKENEDSIDAIITNIVQNVTTCISENIGKIKNLIEYQYEIESNLTNTQFMDSIENEYDTCIKELNEEECVKIGNEMVFKQMTDVETSILMTRSESRNIADDILDTIVSCSKDGLVNASASIAKETLQIVKCVINNNHDIM